MASCMCESGVGSFQQNGLWAVRWDNNTKGVDTERQRGSKSEPLGPETRRGVDEGTAEAETEWSLMVEKNQSVVRRCSEELDVGSCGFVELSGTGKERNDTVFGGVWSEFCFLLRWMKKPQQVWTQQVGMI